MNLRELQYIIAVSEHLHFGEAARVCFVSQPTLSMQIKKVESQLGIDLFERTKQKVHITPAGKQIVEIAKKIIRDCEQIKQIAQTYQDPFSGDLLLGAFPTLAAFIFPYIVQPLSQQYADLRLKCVETKTAELLGQLKSGALDAAFLALPIEDNTLEAWEITFDPFLLAVPSAHPFSQRSVIDIQQLKHETLILLEEGHCLHDQSLSLCSEHNIFHDTQFYATSIETLRQTVASGVGMTILPKMAQKPDDGLSYIPFSNRHIGRRIALVTRKSHPKQKLMDAILHICHQQLSTKQ